MAVQAETPIELVNDVADYDRIELLATEVAG